MNLNQLLFRSRITLDSNLTCQGVTFTWPIGTIKEELNHNAMVLAPMGTEATVNTNLNQPGLHLLYI